VHVIIIFIIFLPIPIFIRFLGVPIEILVMDFDPIPIFIVILIGFIFTLIGFFVLNLCLQCMLLDCRVWCLTCPNRACSAHLFWGLSWLDLTRGRVSDVIPMGVISICDHFSPVMFLTQLQYRVLNFDCEVEM
jgi:hypothetical protein